MSQGYSLSELQKVQNQDNLVNTNYGCMELAHSDAWGTILVPVENPFATKITVDEASGIKLIDNFPKLPSILWGRCINLFFHFCGEDTKEDKTIRIVYNSITKKYEEHEVTSYKNYYKSIGSELEVSVLFCRKADDLSQWRVLVPKQTVSSGSVTANLSETCDIETGEIFNVFPPPGWVHAGSSHSHNTIGAFFSSVDDKSELGVPGLHIVVGSISKKSMSYDSKASIVLRQIRKKVDISDVVDVGTSLEEFHKNVLTMVTKSQLGPRSEDGLSGYLSHFESTKKKETTSGDSDSDPMDDYYGWLSRRYSS